ncbi:MAG: acetoacetate decarboxylase family protein [Dehalococcoidia bacterium]|nr:acetoacetate decarboxylase family protein [Dehalococcoidia bacterium]
MTSVQTEQAAVGASQPTFTILGRDVQLPVEVRDATAAVAYYLVSAGAAQRLVEQTGLRVARVVPGRTLCTIGTMVYKDGDLGPYHEIAVTFFVYEQGARPLPLLGAAIGFLRGSVAAYIHQLPVDGEFTCAAGRTIWGFPKFMSEISVTTDGAEQTAVLNVDGEHVLTQRMATGGTRSFRNRRQISYAHRDGVLYRTPSVMSGAEIGARLGGASLELGPHPIADELRALGLPKKALFSTYIGRMTGTFDAAERVPRPLK